MSPGPGDPPLFGHLATFTSLVSDTAPPVVLLVGPEGIGKCTLALYVAEARGVKPANLLWYDSPPSATDVEYILARAQVRTLGPTAVVLDAGTLSTSAANSLLKLTESPPKGWRFYFHTAALANALPTISSRAMYYSLRPLTSAQVELVLLNKGVSMEKALRVSLLAHGRPGEAYRQLALLDYKPLALRILAAAFSGDAVLCAEVSRSLQAISGDDRVEVATSGDTVRGAMAVACLQRAVHQAVTGYLPGLYDLAEVAPFNPLFSTRHLWRFYERLCAQHGAAGYLVVRWFTSVVVGAVHRREGG